MSAYPPPPPPPPFDPYSRQAMRAQRRYLKDQARMQRAQVRLQMRAARRSSILGPLIILGLGVIFLLAETGRFPWAQSLEWYSRWWPAVLIGAGLVLLAEWAIDQQRRQNGTDGPIRVLGGGVVFLLIVLAIAGLFSHVALRGIAWSDSNLGQNFHNFDHIFGDRHDGYDTLSSAIDPTAGLIIRNPHGDVTVTGSSSDGQVHVNIHTQAYAWKSQDADSKAQRLRPVFSAEGKNLVMTVAAVDGGQGDLIIEVPHNTPVTVQADKGDVTVGEVHAPVTLSANHGDVNLNAIDGDVNVHVNDDDASFNAHSITGDLTIQGHNGDADLSEITGAVNLRGDFFGTTHLEHIRGIVLFETSRTHFEAARIDGDFSVGSDSLDASEILGPVILKTHDKNITLDRVQGSISITNRNGTVSATSTIPLAAINIQNTHGSVDLGVPQNANFSLSATTKNGDIENDFGLTSQGDDDRHNVKAAIGNGGPSVSIVTSDGDVTIRKTTVPPLPPIPPAPPRITTNPPSAPHSPKSPKAPTAPSGPVQPTAPTGLPGIA
jgi:DUF4097 and DUF4098 domain-containing protein YvlB